MYENLDLRVRRTLHHIHEAFYSLILVKDYDEISVTELSNKAGINRKTFYLHYNSLDDLVLEIENEIADKIVAKLEKDARDMNIQNSISIFYHYLEECSDVERKLLSDSGFRYFYTDVTDLIFSSEPMRNFFARTKHPEIVRAYAKCISAIYHDWANSGKKLPLNDLILYASNLVSHGYYGAVEKQ